MANHVPVQSVNTKSMHVMIYKGSEVVTVDQVNLDVLANSAIQTVWNRSGKDLGMDDKH